MGLEAIDRMASVLSALNDVQLESGSEATLNQICERTGLSRSTASRFLNALADHHYVHRSVEGTFSLGAAPSRLSLSPLGRRRLEECAHPHMRSLADAIGEAVCISILDGIETETIFQVGVPTPVFVENWVGRRWPILATGSAISIMSTWSPTQIADRLGRLPAPQRTSIGDAVNAARLNPISWSKDNYVNALTSVSAPILDTQGHATSALIIYGPSFRFPKSKGRVAVAKSLSKAAAMISEDLY